MKGLSLEVGHNEACFHLRWGIMRPDGKTSFVCHLAFLKSRFLSQSREHLFTWIISSGRGFSADPAAASVQLLVFQKQANPKNEVHGHGPLVGAPGAILPGLVKRFQQ